MKLDITIDDTPFSILLRRDGSTVRVEVDGEAFETKVEPAGGDRFTVRLGRARHDVEVPSDDHAVVDGRRVTLRVLAFDARDVGATAGGADGVVRPPMPGAIAAILVKEGQEVAKGTPMVVLEAMKMQNEITAPFSGVVRRLHVKKGDTVTLQDVVLEMDGPDA